MKRFVGMCITFPALAALLVVLGGAFYKLAAWAGWAFAEKLGLPAFVGITLANVVTVMFVLMAASSCGRWSGAKGISSSSAAKSPGVTTHGST